MSAPFSITPAACFAALLSTEQPVLLDVRRPERVAESGRLLPGARLVAPDEGESLVEALPSNRGVFVACAHGHQRSQFLTARLRAAGIPASVVAGGYGAWEEAGLPTVHRVVGSVVLGGEPTTWVTRIRPKIDRIACPWLITRFLDPRARFLFVAPEEVLAVADDAGGVAFDIPGAPFEHAGELCTFDTMLAAFGLDADPHLAALARIVRAADTDRLDLAPQAAGLLAISLGLSAASGEDDHAMLARGLPLYDGLHAWIRLAREERHTWPRAAGQRVGA